MKKQQYIQNKKSYNRGSNEQLVTQSLLSLQKYQSSVSSSLSQVKKEQNNVNESKISNITPLSVKNKQDVASMISRNQPRSPIITNKIQFHRKQTSCEQEIMNQIQAASSKRLKGGKDDPNTYRSNYVNSFYQNMNSKSTYRKNEQEEISDTYSMITYRFLEQKLKDDMKKPKTQVPILDFSKLKNIQQQVNTAKETYGEGGAQSQIYQVLQSINSSPKRKEYLKPNQQKKNPIQVYQNPNRIQSTIYNTLLQKNQTNQKKQNKQECDQVQNNTGNNMSFKDFSDNFINSIDNSDKKRPKMNERKKSKMKNTSLQLQEPKEVQSNFQMRTQEISPQFKANDAQLHEYRPSDPDQIQQIDQLLEEENSNDSQNQRINNYIELSNKVQFAQTAKHKKVMNSDREDYGGYYSEDGECIYHRTSNAAPQIPNANNYNQMGAHMIDLELQHTLLDTGTNTHCQVGQPPSQSSASRQILFQSSQNDEQMIDNTYMLRQRESDVNPFNQIKQLASNANHHAGGKFKTFRQMFPKMSQNDFNKIKPLLNSQSIHNLNLMKQTSEQTKGEEQNDDRNAARSQFSLNNMTDSKSNQHNQIRQYMQNQELLDFNQYPLTDRGQQQQQLYGAGGLQDQIRMRSTDLLQSSCKNSNKADSQIPTSRLSNNLALQVQMQSELTGPGNFVECSGSNSKEKESLSMELDENQQQYENSRNNQSINSLLLKDTIQEQPSLEDSKVFDAAMDGHQIILGRNENYQNNLMSLISASRLQESNSQTGSFIDGGPKELPAQIHIGMSSQDESPNAELQVKQNSLSIKEFRGELSDIKEADQPKNERGSTEKSKTISDPLTQNGISPLKSLNNEEEQNPETENSALVNQILSIQTLSSRSEAPQSQMSEDELTRNKSIKPDGYHQQSFDHLNILNQAAAGIMPTGPGVRSNSNQSKNETKERNEELFKEIEKESFVFEEENTPYTKTDIANRHIEMMENQNLNSNQCSKKLNSNQDEFNQYFNQEVYTQYTKTILEVDNDSNSLLQNLSKPKIAVNIDDDNSTIQNYEQKLEYVNNHSQGHLQLEKKAISQDGQIRNSRTNFAESKISVPNGMDSTANFNLSASGTNANQSKSYLNNQLKQGNSSYFRSGGGADFNGCNSLVQQPHLKTGTDEVLLQSRSDEEPLVILTQTNSELDLGSKQDCNFRLSSVVQELTDYQGKTGSPQPQLIQPYSSAIKDQTEAPKYKDDCEVSYVKTTRAGNKAQLLIIENSDQSERNKTNQNSSSRIQSSKSPTDNTVSKFKSPFIQQLDQEQLVESQTSNALGQERNTAILTRKYERDLRNSDEAFDNILIDENQNIMRMNYKVSDSINDYMFQANRYQGAAEDLDEDIIQYASAETNRDGAQEKFDTVVPKIQVNDFEKQEEIKVSQTQVMSQEKEQSSNTSSILNKNQKITPYNLDAYKDSLVNKLDQNISTPSMRDLLNERKSLIVSESDQTMYRFSQTLGNIGSGEKLLQNPEDRDQIMPIIKEMHQDCNSEEDLDEDMDEDNTDLNNQEEDGTSNLSYGEENCDSSRISSDYQPPSEHSHTHHPGSIHIDYSSVTKSQLDNPQQKHQRNNTGASQLSNHISQSIQVLARKEAEHISNIQARKNHRSFTTNNGIMQQPLFANVRNTGPLGRNKGGLATVYTATNYNRSEASSSFHLNKIASTISLEQTQSKKDYTNVFNQNQTPIIKENQKQLSRKSSSTTKKEVYPTPPFQRRNSFNQPSKPSLYNPNRGMASCPLRTCLQRSYSVSTIPRRQTHMHNTSSQMQSECACTDCGYERSKSRVLHEAYSRAMDLNNYLMSEFQRLGENHQRQQEIQDVYNAYGNIQQQHSRQVSQTSQKHSIEKYIRSLKNNPDISTNQQQIKAKQQVIGDQYYTVAAQSMNQQSLSNNFNQGNSNRSRILPSVFNSAFKNNQTQQIGKNKYK